MNLSSNRNSLPQSAPARLRKLTGFTLVELLVSMTFVVILMLVVTQVIGVVQRSWVRANSRVSQFREARMAFDIISRNLSQATLNTYWENQFDPLGTDAAGQKLQKAKNYVRRSELQFICGPTTSVLSGAASGSSNFPGHAVFFQAPLGITNLVASTGGNQANTENMVNLMCGRGYFVEWGSDESFRPPFLSSMSSVPVRNRMRLMEYSPTAEMNRIYDSTLRPLVDSETGVNNGKRWFNEGQNAVLTNIVSAGETVATRAFTRPVAENILALIISPQQEVTGNGTALPYAIAPNYRWDSTLVTQQGAASNASNPQGTQHLLPPLLKVSMIALDQMSGEELSRDEQVRKDVLNQIGSMFQTANKLPQELGDADGSGGDLQKLLVAKKLNYRVFTTTIVLKQARWSL